MQRFIDTNILYYKFDDKAYPVDIVKGNIVSVNALEFLKNIEKVHNNRAKYYVPANAFSHFPVYERYLRERKHALPSQVLESARGLLIRSRIIDRETPGLHLI
jgi:hypothetical protein